jgi:hypothetical protein
MLHISLLVSNKQQLLWKFKHSGRALAAIDQSLVKTISSFVDKQTPIQTFTGQTVILLCSEFKEGSKSYGTLIKLPE